jgi:2-methylisocitrate lyase-like PEP mutase family enzyme
MTKAQVIRQALASAWQLIMPGVYDALSAKIAARAGFEVTFHNRLQLIGDTCWANLTLAY